MCVGVQRWGMCKRGRSAGHIAVRGEDASECAWEWALGLRRLLRQVAGSIQKSFDLGGKVRSVGRYLLEHVAGAPQFTLREKASAQADGGLVDDGLESLIALTLRGKNGPKVVGRLFVTVVGKVDTAEGEVGFEFFFAVRPRCARIPVDLIEV